MLRSYYVARKYRLLKECNFSKLDKTCHAWEQDGRIHWVKRGLPEDVELLLFDDTDEENEQSYVEAREESDENDVDES